jgi:flagellar hook-associated protein 3 FlgL
MSFVTSGDAARFATFAQDVSRLKTDLQRHPTELGSGRKADIGRAVAGDFTGLSDVQRGLRLNRSFLVGLSNAAALPRRGRPRSTGWAANSTMPVPSF